MVAMWEALRVRVSDERRGGSRHLDMFSKVELRMQAYDFIHIRNTSTKFSVGTAIGKGYPGTVYPIEFHF